MEIRKYRPEDLPEIARLFEETIRQVNAGDYTKEQIQAWASRGWGLLGRNEFFERLYTLVALENGQITGYGNIDDAGYLDHLYVHKDWQGRGIASAICGRLEEYAGKLGRERITVYASVTARPFFEKRGYTAVEEHQAVLDGISLTNYFMEKKL